MNISVIIPSYNSSKTLLRCLESVLDQTFPVFEIIVCDDGSDDDSYQIIQKFHYVNIKWIDCGRNGGPAIPRNIGILNSKGDWIAFLDSDDYWRKDKIEKQVKLINENNFNAICSNAIVINNYITTNNLYFKDKTSCNFTFYELIYENQIITSTVLINKETLIRANYFPQTKKLIVGEDYSLWLLITNYCNWFYDSTPLIYYSDFPDESIRKFSKGEYFIKFQVIKSVFLKISIKKKIYSILYIFKRIIYLLFNAQVA
jgi:glycosyltransferase involved in cell wall biosynthesis